MALTHDRRGIYKKYIIKHADGTDAEENATFFSIRVDADPYASKALLAYSISLDKNSNEEDFIAGQMASAVRLLARHKDWSGFSQFGIELDYKVVGKEDGTPLDTGAEYFVFRIDNDPHSVPALYEYAGCVFPINPTLSRDLIELASMRTWTYIDTDLVKPYDLVEEEDD